MIECMQDAGKEDYLRPSERIGLDWIVLVFVSRDFEVGSNDGCDSQKYFFSDLNEIWCVGRGR